MFVPGAILNAPHKPFRTLSQAGVHCLYQGMEAPSTKTEPCQPSFYNPNSGHVCHTCAAFLCTWRQLGSQDWPLNDELAAKPELTALAPRPWAVVHSCADLRLVGLPFALEGRHPV